MKPIDHERVAELVRQGMTIPQIAEAMKCCTRSVERARKRLGLAGPAPKRLTTEQLALAEQLLDDGCSMEEVARTIGCSAAPLHARFPGRAWSPTEVGRHGGFCSRMAGSTWP